MTYQCVRHILPFFLGKSRADFDVTTSRLQNKVISREFIATLQTIALSQFVVLQHMQ